MRMIKCRILNKGFTLTELLIILALVILIAALAIPMGIGFLQERRVEEEALSLANSLKTAQARAKSGKHDSAWGIKLNKPGAGQYTLFPLFESDSFEDEGRDSSYDEVFQLSSGAQIEGTDEIDEIVFEKLTGKIMFY